MLLSDKFEDQRGLFDGNFKTVEENLKFLKKIHDGSLDELREELMGYSDEKLAALMKSLDARFEKVFNDLMKSQNKMGEEMKNGFEMTSRDLKFLATQLEKSNGRIEQNEGDIRNLQRAVELLKQQLEDSMEQVGSSLDNIGETDYSGALNALEDQIAEAGGLNIGDRWRLRFKDDVNKDIFLQDREKKGYYRFRTTACDHIVKGVKCDPNCCECTSA